MSAAELKLALNYDFDNYTDARVFHEVAYLLSRGDIEEALSTGRDTDQQIKILQVRSELNISHLAESLKASRSTVQRSLPRLIELKCVEPIDKRRCWVNLPEGPKFRGKPSAQMIAAMQTTLPVAEQAVLLVYAACVDEWGVAWPGKRFLMKKTGYSKSPVLEAKASLKDLGFLVPVRGPRARAFHVDFPLEHMQKKYKKSHSWQSCSPGEENHVNSIYRIDSQWNLDI